MASKRRRRRRNRGPLILLCFSVTLLLIAIGLRLFFQKPQVDDTPDTPPDDTRQEAVTGPAGGENTDPSGTATADPVRTKARRKDVYTILVLGVDNGNGCSDTNILVTFDAGADTINCVSIPRDSGFYVNGKAHKINYAYNRGGTDLLVQSLSDGLGIPIDYTVEVDLEGFVKLVDEIGGVEFNVPINMDYDDPLQDLSIHLKKGVQRLNGENALNVVRFRHNNDGTGYGTEDLGRIGTQQAFLKAVVKQIVSEFKSLSPLDVPGRIADFARLFDRYVTMDLSVGNLGWLGTEAISMGTDAITFATLPGEWSSSRSLYLLDADAVLELVNSALSPYVEPRIAEDLDLVQ